MKIKASKIWEDSEIFLIEREYWLQTSKNL